MATATARNRVFFLKLDLLSPAQDSIKPPRAETGARRNIRNKTLVS